MFCGGSSPKIIVLHYTESKSPLWGSVFKKCSKNIIVLIVRTRNPDFLRFSGKIKRDPQTDPTNSYLVRILFTGLLMVLCQIQLFNKHLSEALKS